MKHYLTIRPGETRTIKKSAKILSVINDGVDYTTTCANGTLPAETEMECRQMSWILSSDNTPSDAWENGTAKFFNFMGVRYPINAALSDIDTIVERINAQIPIPLFTVFYKATNLHGEWNENDGENYGVAMKFRTIKSEAAEIYLEVSAAHSPVVRFYSIAIDCPVSP